MPARRKLLHVPKGLKPVRRTLATGEVRVYWYHRATGKRLYADPEAAEGLLKVAALDREAEGTKAASALATGSYAHLWQFYTDSPEWRSLKPRTRSDYQAVRDWLGKAADQPIATLTIGMVYRLRDKAFRARGRRFANYVMQVLSLTLEWGRKRGLLKVNVAWKADKIARPRGQAKVNRAWTAAEVEAFAAAAPPQLQLPFMLALFAGMRQGDALRVTWSAYNGSEISWVASKNGEDCCAPVSGHFKTALDRAKLSRGLVVQIATTANGTAWTASGFRASFFKLVAKLEEAGALRPGCTFHGLRHTIAAIARNSGESDSRVAASIGDKSTAMAAVYGRDADRAGAQAAVLEAIQKRFANVDWKTPTENARNGASRRARQKS